MAHEWSCGNISFNRPLPLRVCHGILDTKSLFDQCYANGLQNIENISYSHFKPKQKQIAGLFNETLFVFLIVSSQPSSTREEGKNEQRRLHLTNASTIQLKS